jgi:ribosome recycling factor
MNEFNWKDLQADTKIKMEKSIDVLKHNFLTIRTGNANPSMLDAISVSVYGAMMPISQVASVNAPEPRLLTISVWDKDNVNAVDKAIRESNLGFNPAVDGTLMRIAIPPLSEERRRDFVKLAKGFCEDCKIAIRGVRQKSMDMIKAAEKEKSISETEMHGYQDEIQKMTDTAVKSADEVLSVKEADIMKV